MPGWRIDGVDIMKGGKKDRIFILVRHVWNENGRNVHARQTYKSNFENQRYTIINIYKFGKLTLQRFKYYYLRRMLKTKM